MTLPRATFDSDRSITSGGAPATGVAKAMGLVPKTGWLAPHGAMALGALAIMIAISPRLGIAFHLHRERAAMVRVAHRHDRDAHLARQRHARLVGGVERGVGETKPRVDMERGRSPSAAFTSAPARILPVRTCPA
jgi:hypothetical protein